MYKLYINYTYKNHILLYMYNIFYNIFKYICILNCLLLFLIFLKLFLKCCSILFICLYSYDQKL